MGSHLTWPHALFVCEGFFLDPFCVVGGPKKTLAVGGQVFRCLVRFFSDLSGIVPCQTYGFPLDLAPWASSVRRFVLDPFCV